VARVLQHGDDHHPGQVGEGAHRLECLPGPLHGHLHLHDHRVRAQIAGQAQGLLVVGDLSDDLHAPVLGQYAGEALAEHGVVVGQEHPYRPPRPRLSPTGLLRLFAWREVIYRRTFWATSPASRVS
jgi:hypothetical protein